MKAENEVTVKPVYNELSYKELPVITEHIVLTDRIDFFKNLSVITKTRF
jgi:hypothetical protein